MSTDLHSRHSHDVHTTLDEKECAVNMDEQVTIEDIDQVMNKLNGIDKWMMSMRWSWQTKCMFVVAGMFIVSDIQLYIIVEMNPKISQFV